ncbi:MAG: ABC transporter ATP-binding protein [Lachnospiraceae bacterium]|nr:ABC transporter ATP-binding protein [Lachnospiraceae bacterium]
MAFMQLKNIGKIYVSDGAVAVGIRNVNLSFDPGEFVAITGASGSGKSTLLNVISGMDTYEEGELLIEGNPTSHYVQSDWEEYREKYISFIFQDYNIIDSFTVLQNVELSLMSIRSPLERRRRAMELLKRVGLEKHLRQKGSRLSGGQKQRCVIARALAKDSPIILADEPTGNLDAQSSKEIIELLREVSKDKLLIVVTHNFEEVENYATRHVRVFDGAIESDRKLVETVPVSANATPFEVSAETSAAAPAEAEKPVEKAARELSRDVRNGLHLGWASFLARPKLTAFLCLILLIGTLGAVLISGFIGDAFAMFGKFYMFKQQKGRVILSNRIARDFTEAELEELSKKYGASTYYRYDAILDADVVTEHDFQITYDRFFMESFDWVTVKIGATKEAVGPAQYGRYPEAEDEALLYVPLCYKNYYIQDGQINRQLNSVGMDMNPIRVFSSENYRYEIVGIRFFLDNTKPAKLVLTEKGYDRLAEAVSKHWNEVRSLQNNDIGSFFMVLDSFNNLLHPDDGVYNQASLIFKSESDARKAVEKLTKDGYLACTSKETYHPDLLDIAIRIFVGGFSFLMWVGSIIFLTFFVNLCTHRSLDVVKGDLTIFRSMGISVKVIKISMFIRMYISVIPAFLITLVLGLLVYHSPNYNNFVRYLHFRDYAIVVIGILLITTLVTRKQIKRLFNESVKKTLRGGAEA